MKWNFGTFCPSAAPTKTATVELDRCRWSTACPPMWIHSRRAWSSQCPWWPYRPDAGNRCCAHAEHSNGLMVLCCRSPLGTMVHRMMYRMVHHSLDNCHENVLNVWIKCKGEKNNIPPISALKINFKIVHSEAFGPGNNVRCLNINTNNMMEHRKELKTIVFTFYHRWRCIHRIAVRYTRIFQESSCLLP